MKKLITCLALLISVVLQGQTLPPTIHHVYKKDTTVASTVTFSMYATVDTVFVFLPCPNDTVKPPVVVQPKLARMLYVGSTEFLDAIQIPDRGKELKWYLQDYKYTGVSYYGLGSTSSSDWPAIRALNKDLRLLYGIKKIEATGGSLTSVLARIAFNNSCTDPREKFDIYNNEDEYWNADPNGDKVHSDAEVLAAWKPDSAAMTSMSTALSTAGIEFKWYHGWPIKNVIPMHMLRKLSYFQYHIYTPGTLNVDYGDWRWKDANTACGIDHVRKKASVIISGEGGFSGPWLATTPLDTVDAMLIRKFKQYPNLELSEVQYFMYSKMKAYQKPKHLVTPAGMARMIPQAPDTSTSQSHRETAIER